MVLKKWADAWNLYNACGAGRLFKAVYAPKKMILYWYLWSATAFYLFSDLLFFYGPGRWSLIGLGLTFSSFWVLFVMVEKVLAKEFEIEYAVHGISNFPFSMRRLYLRYALFFNGLSNQTPSNGSISSLRRFAEVADKPDPAFRLSQHPIIVPLVTVFVVLSTELIKQSEIWKNGKGAIFIFVIGSGLLFLTLVLGEVRSTKHKHQEIQRFLEWAEFDIEEKKFELGDGAQGISCNKEDTTTALSEIQSSS